MKITFTGIDTMTPLIGLAELLAEFPLVEVAFLYSAKRAGNEPRYPSLAQIEAAVQVLSSSRVAVHICGGAARRLLCQGRLLADWPIGRVQINGRVSPIELDEICRHQSRRRWVITQCTGSEHIGEPASNHAVLMDSSGGRGDLPQIWTRPDTDKQVGFAGGLGPDTIRRAMPEIAALARPGDWIDMETGVRTDDWFDVEKVREVCDYVIRKGPFAL